MNLLWQQKLCNLQQLKNRRFHIQQPTFLFPSETPLRLSRNMLHEWKDNPMLAKPLAALGKHVPINLQQFPSYTMLKSMRKSKNRYFYHIFVSPGDAPEAMLYGWKENSMLTNCLAACTHLSSTVSQLFELQVQKIAVFTYCSPHFCFPWRRPCNYHAICCVDGKTIQCLPTPRCMYPSIFNSFRVIRCLSQCVSPKIAILTTFLFPLGTPLGQSR